MENKKTALKLLDEMAEIGVIEYNYENLDGKNPNHERRYVVPPFVPGSAEFMNMNEKQLEAHPELGRMFEQLSRLPLMGMTQMFPPGGAGAGMHVIPVEKAIETENKSVDVEHISHWLKKYDRYAASPCSCRMSRKTYDEGCADDPRDWCIAVGDMAEYVVETNKGGRYVSYDEVLEILRKAEENGFVHQITNIDGKDKIFAICNCNVNVCYALRTSQLFNTPNLSRSAYVAKVDSENCVACGRCVEFCPAGAVKLGQKLCTVNGPIEYPRHEDPAVTPWDESKWDWDYRNTNRTNCYDTGTSPCKTACPAHIAVQGYLKLAAQGRYKEALQVIKRENPFPAVCGRICNRRCEDACTRGTVDRAIAIGEVKRFIAQKDLDAESRFVPEKVIPKVVGEFDEKIAIIGGGPAGLTCAYYLAEKGYRPTVFEKGKRVGGMMMNGIPSFRLEKDVVSAEIDIIRQLGVEFRCGVEVGKDVTIQQLREQGYKAFFLAIGAQGARMAGIPGEDGEGVISAVDLMYKLSVDENEKLPGRTVVIGGGNVATDVARAAMRAGSESVSLFCLESRENMPASVEEIEESEKEGVSINNAWGPAEICLNDGKVCAVRFKKCLSTTDGNGSFAPRYDEDDTVTVECDNVVLAIGQRIIWGDLLKGTAVQLNPNGTVVADPVTLQTAEPDIFAGGDALTGPKWTIDAIVSGKEGSVSLHRFVQPHSSLTIGRNLRKFIELDKTTPLALIIRRVSFPDTMRRCARPSATGISASQRSR